MGLFRRRAKGSTPEPADRSADVRPLDGGEQQRVEALIRSLRSSGVDTDDPRSLGSAYDAGFMAWTVRPHPSREDAQPLITRVGIGMGQHLVDNARLSWCMAGDRLAVTSSTDQPLIRPVDLVAERWQRGELGWVADWLIETKRELARDRGEPG